MDLSVFKSITIPPPELTSAASLKMAKLDDQTCDQTSGEGKLMLELSLHKPPQQRARGRPSKQQQAFPPSFHPPPGLVQQSAPQACPQEWPKPPLQQPALPQPVVQQPASATNSFATTSCSTNFHAATFCRASFSTEACEKTNHTEGPRTSSQQASQHLGKGGEDHSRDRACGQCFRRRA